MLQDTSKPEHAWVNSILQEIAVHLHQIPYGNLRSELTTWHETSEMVENLAIVYEVPGGSTNQINVTHFDKTGEYIFLALDTHVECCTSSLEEASKMVRELVARIPAIRKERLLEDIDRWAEQGMGQRELFQKMNALLQVEDLRGGTITMAEMKHGIAHILARYRSSN